MRLLLQPGSGWKEEMTGSSVSPQAEEEFIYPGAEYCDRVLRNS